MSLCRVFFCVVGRECLLWPVCSIGKPLLSFALLHSVLQGQICLLLQMFLVSALSYSFPNFEPVWCSMFGSNFYFLTHIQVFLETGKVFWYSHIFKNFPQFVVIHTVKRFSIVNEGEEDVFLESPCFLHDPMNIDNLISGSSAFSESSLYIWKFSVHVLLKPSLKDFEYNLASLWNECICMVVLNILWHCPSLGLEWKLTFSGPVATTGFSKFAGILSAALSQHHLLRFEIAQLESITFNSFVNSNAS